MKKSMVVIGVFVLLGFVSSQVCFAQMINYNRRNKNAASASKTPPAPAAPAAASMPAAAKEEAYGMNENKADQPAENNVLLKDVVAAVNKNGSYKVNSDVLKKYDKNNDGIISKAEAKALEADIR